MARPQCIKFKAFQSPPPKGVQKRSQQNTPTRNSPTPLHSTASPMRLAALSNIALGSTVGVPFPVSPVPATPSPVSPSPLPVCSTPPSVSAPPMLPPTTTPRRKANFTALNFHMEMFATTGAGAAISTSSPAPTPRRRTAEEHRVAQVLDALDITGFSLNKFLVAITNSKDKDIMKAATQFYSHGGPAAVVRSWGAALRNKSYDYSFIDGAVDVISGRVQTDLNRIANKKAFSHPATSISRKKIHDFSMDRLKYTFETTAPTLTLVLEGLIPPKKSPAKKSTSILTENAQDVQNSCDSTDIQEPVETLPPRDDTNAPLSPTQAMSSEEEEEEEEEEELEFSELDSDLGSDSGLESDWGTDSGSDSGSDSNLGSVGSAKLDTDLDFATSTSASDGDDVDSTNLLNRLGVWIPTRRRTFVQMKKDHGWMMKRLTTHSQNVR
ncbi:hypothetical protein K457DRAFT_441948 [Linnemannia elongata AG-77]|uniref:Uncharacterized protein n=1 Tax=Linnemannia elongata AG-77 TaxID=1314771 RepID=A0A197K2K5_9FUNG|nr:hypothetical protein K457DRAFT_441948 [Linnemannia elongata AG-77]